MISAELDETGDVKKFLGDPVLGVLLVLTI